MHEARHRTGTSTWWVRPRALAALVAAAAGLTAVWLPGRNDVAAASEHRPVFADDFDDRRGAGLDRSKWRLDGDSDRARHDGDGNLVVSRLMLTRTAFAEPFGHAEARIKVRRATGPWRAFGAVDKYGRVLRGEVEILDRAERTAGDDFHTYAIDWSPTSVLWSVDGRPSLRLTPDEPGLPIALVLNLATDGRRPSRMVVDFVRVIAGREAPTPTPTPTRPTPEPPTAPPTSATPTAPPITTPPSTTPTTPPPATTPPATRPPVTQPPATKPPATRPPTPKPPAAKAWKPYTAYSVGDLVTFGGATYRVKEAHTALPGWQPTALPALFQKV